jgi:hypothetical protein
LSPPKNKEKGKHQFFQQKKYLFPHGSSYFTLKFTSKIQPLIKKKRSPNSNFDAKAFKVCNTKPRDEATRKALKRDPTKGRRITI